MVYKNTWKTYLFVALFTGALYGFLMGLVYMSVVRGLLMGILFGSLFTVAIAVINHFTEKKFVQKRAEISSQRRIICDGAATHNGNGGWMFLTEFGLEFYPHKLNFSTNRLIIPLGSITGLSVKSNRVEISTTGGVFSIVVVKATDWLLHIQSAISMMSVAGQNQIPPQE